MRLFIASNFQVATVLAIEAAVARVQPRLPRSSWLKSEAYHLTYAFLGEHPESVVAPLSASLRKHLGDVSRIETRVGEPGFFPNEKRPRVGWLAVDPDLPLKSIGDRVRASVQEAHVAFDEKPFVPHLTLVRMRAPWNRRDAENFLVELGTLRAPASTIDAVTLFASVLGSGGAIHTPVATIRLG